MSFESRRVLYEQIERDRNTKVIAYVTGDRPSLEAHMSPGDVDYFVHHLDEIGDVKKITLVLYTLGGATISAWSIANILLTFCDELDIIVPSKCQSAGTLLCLAANGLVMTKQAQLGPIDPSVPSQWQPANPAPPGMMMPATFGVSVEDVNAYFEQARVALPNQPLHAAFDKLASMVHPLLLGNAFRVRSQIRMLGRRLLETHLNDSDRIDKILDFLCSDSGSHDYTIGRREARLILGLPVETPSEDLYGLINGIQRDFVDEMELRSPPNAAKIAGDADFAAVSFPRKLIESPAFGSHVWTTDAHIVRRGSGAPPGVRSNIFEYERYHDEWKEFRNDA